MLTDPAKPTEIPRASFRRPASRHHQFAVLFRRVERALGPGDMFMIAMSA